MPDAPPPDAPPGPRRAHRAGRDADARLDAGARARLLRAIRLEGLEPLPTPAVLRAALDAVREGGTAEDDAPPAPQAARTTLPRLLDPWEELPALRLDPSHLARGLLVAAGPADAAHGAFDVLRTRVVQAMAERGWRRLGVTSPTQGCGKSFTSANLAAALSRTDRRTILLDMDLRVPSLARLFGAAGAPAMGDLLRGDVGPGAFLRRVAPGPRGIGAALALGLNGRREAYAAELFQGPATARALGRLQEEMAPDVVILDMPPALARDDVIALAPHVDCLLMVVGGGQTTAREMRETARRLGEGTPILGVVLNRAEGVEARDYGE